MSAVVSWARRATLFVGFVFLYAPIVILAVMSFNASRLVSVWGGFSTKWYAALLENEQLLHSAKISLAAALTSATISTLLGLLAAISLTRFGRFRTRFLFFGAVHAPLVLPEVVLGLALLTCFVAFGVGRGFITLVIGHVTLTMCFTTVAILAALRDQRSGARRSGDGSRGDAFGSLCPRRVAADRAGDRHGLSLGVHAFSRRSCHRQFCDGPWRDDAADAHLLTSALGRFAADQRHFDAASRARRRSARTRGACFFQARAARWPSGDKLGARAR